MKQDMQMFSYQLYSSRNFPPTSATLAMLAKAGYSSVEGLGGLYATDDGLAEIASGINANGLTMPTAHFPIELLQADPDRVIHIAKTLGIERIYCPWIAPEMRGTTAAEWKALGALLQNVSVPLRSAGIGFGWHNHDFEFIALPDGTFPQDALFDGGPDLEWEMDVAWVIKGGADPFEWIKTYANRITAAHVKDIAPLGENADEDGWADVGHGTVDWAGLMAALRAIGVKNFVMEHDNPSDHARFATRSIVNAKTY
jgi:sugar phosphate isomerase/epimerase